MPRCSEQASEWVFEGEREEIKRRSLLSEDLTVPVRSSFIMEGSIDTLHIASQLDLASLALLLPARTTADVFSPSLSAPLLDVSDRSTLLLSPSTAPLSRQQPPPAHDDVKEHSVRPTS